MKQILRVFLLATILFAITIVYAGGATVESPLIDESARANILNQVLLPSAKIIAGKSQGSATVIYSQNGTTLLITCHHVIAINIEYVTRYNSSKKDDEKVEIFSPVQVIFNHFDTHGRYVASVTVLSDIIAYDEGQDLALLKLRDTAQYSAVTLYPQTESQNIPILSTLCCCGAALGHLPLVTFGTLNAIQIDIEGYEYWVSSANSIFGNSGGGVFLRCDGNNWKFIGVPSRIAVVPIGWGGSAVTHMGYFAPPFRIYDWLKTTEAGELLDIK